MRNYYMRRTISLIEATFMCALMMSRHQMTSKGQ